MEEKTVVGLLFTAFVLVRMRWPRGSDERQKVKSIREWITSSLFTFSLLASYGGYLGSNLLSGCHFSVPFVVQIVGLGLSVSGIVVLEWVHRALGKHFSPHLELRSDHQIVTSGPYRYVRHPMYSCGLFFLLGTGLVSKNWMVLGLPLLTFVLLLSLRIRDEEKMLSQRFGKDWDVYVQKTGFLFPKLQ